MGGAGLGLLRVVRVVVVVLVWRHETNSTFGQAFEQRLGFFEDRVVAQVGHEQHAIGAAHELRQPCLHELTADRGRVDQLHVHIFEIHHAALRLERRERVVGDLRMCVGQRRNETRFPRVRRAHQRELSGTFVGHVAGIGATTALATPLRLDVVLQARQLAAQLGAQLLRSLVLWNDRHHVAQRLELFGRGGRLLEALLRIEILRRQVGGHGDLHDANPKRDAWAILRKTAPKSTPAPTSRKNLKRNVDHWLGAASHFVSRRRGGRLPGAGACALLAVWVLRYG